MSVSAIGLNWLQILEKEFDISFVETDTCLAHVFSIISDTEDGVNCSTFNDLMVNICDARQHLTQLSSVFTQLVHKTITIANNNHSLTVSQTNIFSIGFNVFGAKYVIYFIIS